MYRYEKWQQLKNSLNSQRKRSVQYQTLNESQVSLTSLDHMNCVASLWSSKLKSSERKEPLSGIFSIGDQWGGAGHGG